VIWGKSWTSYPDHPRLGVDVRVWRVDTPLTAADYIEERHALCERVYKGTGITVTRDGMKLTCETPKHGWFDRSVVVKEYSDTPLMLNPDEYQGSL